MATNNKFVRFWDPQKNQGTCFHPAHTKNALDALLENLDRGQKKLVVASAKIGVIGFDLTLALSTDEELAKVMVRSSFAPYLNDFVPGHAPLTHPEGWGHIQDALFSVFIENVGTYDSVQFDTFENFRSFLGEVAVDENGAQYGSIHISCYFVEDNTLPVLHRLRGTNAIWGALRGSHGNWPGVNTVCATPFGGEPADIANARAFMEAIWNDVWGAPPAATWDELRAAFWMTSTIKHSNIFKSGRGVFFLSPGNTRGCWNVGGANWESAGGQNGNYYQSKNIWYYDWDTHTFGQIYRADPYPPKDKNRSYIVAFSAEINGGTHRAIYLKPYSVDSVWTNWFDMDENEVMLEGSGEHASSVFYKVTEANSDAYVLNNVNSNTGACLKSNDFYMSAHPIRWSSHPRRSVAMRLHKKGTPYVSVVGPNKMVSDNGYAGPYFPRLILR